MSNKDIKEERIRKLFAETAKKMILESGVESVSVRKIAKEAGYSLRTIYNHFKNLDELLWLVRDFLIVDIAMHNLKESQGLHSSSDLSASYKKYMQYYLSNPNVFRFFYFHQLGEQERSSEKTQSDSILEKEVEKTCQFISRTGGFSISQSSLIYRLFTYAVHGMLMLAITGNDDLKAEQLDLEIDQMVNLILHQED